MRFEEDISPKTLPVGKIEFEDRSARRALLDEHSPLKVIDKLRKEQPAQLAERSEPTGPSVEQLAATLLEETPVTHERLLISQEDLEGDDTLKPTNPKDAIGSDKIPLHLWPETASIAGSLGMLDGMLKYGRSNFRAMGIRASIYYDACRRHINAWFEGEDLDPDSGIPHLSHALACLAIIVDAQAAGKFVDDRMVRGGYRKWIDTMTVHVKRLKEKHKNKNPKHWTIKDNQYLEVE